MTENQKQKIEETSAILENIHRCLNKNLTKRQYYDIEKCIENLKDIISEKKGNSRIFDHIGILEPDIDNAAEQVETAMKQCGFSDIEIDGVFGEGSHRAVRFLSMRSPVSRVSVANVFGTFYASGIMLSYWYPPTGVRGRMSCLSFRNIHADFALPPGWTEARNPRYNWPLVWIDGDLDIDSLSFDNLSRREDPSARETIGVGAHTHIENLALTNILQRAAPGGAPVLLRNAGRIDRLRLRDIDAGGAPVLENIGLIGRLLEDDRALQD